MGRQKQKVNKLCVALIEQHRGKNKKQIVVGESTTINLQS